MMLLVMGLQVSAQHVDPKVTTTFIRTHLMIADPLAVGRLAVILLGVGRRPGPGTGGSGHYFQRIAPTQMGQGFVPPRAPSSAAPYRTSLVFDMMRAPLRTLYPCWSKVSKTDCQC
ncbi:hypothetical protein MB46_06720 [Arthrobacter alpinus]|nr:hypothetical protein MB46_06720 [Arthrobacter alpinus]